MPFLSKAALQQTKNCTATLKKLRCTKVELFCRFPADFKLPRLGLAEATSAQHTQVFLGATPSEQPVEWRSWKSLSGLALPGRDNNSDQPSGARTRHPIAL